MPLQLGAGGMKKTLHMRIRFISSCFLAAALLLGSCSTPKNITYFPDLGTGAVVQAERQLDIRVKPEDKLSIVVNTQDPALSALFNLLQVQEPSWRDDVNDKERGRCFGWR